MMNAHTRWLLGSGLVLALLSVFGGLVRIGLSRFEARLVYPRDTTPIGDLAGAQTVVFTTEDGLELRGWYVPAQPGQPTILYFHGNGGSVRNRRVRLARMRAAGLGVFMPEYRGYGGNPGVPSEAGLTQDARAAWAEIQRLGVLSPVLYGESLGTGVATQLATTTSPRALILEAPYTSLPDVGATRFSILAHWLMTNRFNTLAIIGQVQVPVLVLQGARDTVIPPSQGVQVYEAAHDPKQLWTAPEGGHEDLDRFGREKVVEAFLQALPP